MEGERDLPQVGLPPGSLNRKCMHLELNVELKAAQLPEAPLPPFISRCGTMKIRSQFSTAFRKLSGDCLEINRASLLKLNVSFAEPNSVDR